MAATRILVSGLPREAGEELDTWLHHFFGEADIRFLAPGPPTDKPGDLQRQYDLLICYVPMDGDPQFVRAYLGYLADVIYQCGAWACLPIVLVGGPDERSMPDKADPELFRLYKLRASAYLPGSAGCRSVARRAWLTFNATWWGGQTKAAPAGREADDDGTASRPPVPVSHSPALPVLVVDDKGVIVRANAEARRKFGDELVNRPYSRAVEKRERDDLADSHPIVRAIRGGAPVGSDLESTNPGGRGEWAYVLYSPIIYASQKPSLVAVTFLELPSWKQLQCTAPANHVVGARCDLAR